MIDVIITVFNHIVPLLLQLMRRLNLFAFRDVVFLW